MTSAMTNICLCGHRGLEHDYGGAWPIRENYLATGHCLWRWCTCEQFRPAPKASSEIGRIPARSGIARGGASP